MNAEQMFKELGYVKYTGKNIIRYQICGVLTYNIEFLLDYKYVSCWTYDSFDGTKSGFSIDMKEMKAIIQQLKELGWCLQKIK